MRQVDSFVKHLVTAVIFGDYLKNEFPGIEKQFILASQWSWVPNKTNVDVAISGKYSVLIGTKKTKNKRENDLTHQDKKKKR